MNINDKKKSVNIKQLWMKTVCICSNKILKYIYLVWNWSNHNWINTYILYCQTFTCMHRYKHKYIYKYYITHFHIKEPSSRFSSQKYVHPFAATSASTFLAMTTQCEAWNPTISTSSWLKLWLRMRVPPTQDIGNRDPKKNSLATSVLRGETLTWVLNLGPHSF